jgi:hypothetical protein
MPKYQIQFSEVCRLATFDGEPGDHRPSVYFYAEIFAQGSDDSDLRLSGPWQTNQDTAKADLMKLHETVEQLNKL